MKAPLGTSKLLIREASFLQFGTVPLPLRPDKGELLFKTMSSSLLLLCLLATLGEGFHYPPIYPPWISGVGVKTTESPPTIKETSTTLKATESPAVSPKPVIPWVKFRHIVRKFHKLLGELKHTQSMSF